MDTVTSVARNDVTLSKGSTKVHAKKVLEHEAFGLYVSRVVRKHVASSYLEEDHIVISDEDCLIEKARVDLQKYMAENIPSWDLKWKICKIIITEHMRNLAKDRLEMHDIDDQTRDEVFEKFRSDDFSSLWPTDWAA